MPREYKQKDRTGEKFNRLTAISPTNSKGDNNTYLWMYRCDCGTEKVIDSCYVVTGQVKSCGCLSKEITTKRNTKHGGCKRGGVTTEYIAWAGMLKRCSNNTTERNKKNYIERGITVCSEWLNSFDVFLKDVGNKPCDGQRWSLGREDNNKGYSPSNCRWETDEQQARNKRKPVTNTTGTMNVQEVDCKGIKTYRVVVGRLSKSFSCRKYGEDAAKALAISWRDKLIKQLSEQGEYHAESHGK